MHHSFTRSLTKHWPHTHTGTHNVVDVSRKMEIQLCDNRIMQNLNTEYNDDWYFSPRMAVKKWFSNKIGMSWWNEHVRIEREKKMNRVVVKSTYSYRSFRSFQTIVYVPLCTFGSKPNRSFSSSWNFNSNKTVNSCFSLCLCELLTKPNQTKTNKKMYERMFDSSFEYEFYRNDRMSLRARMNFSHVIIYNCKYIGHFKSFSKDDNDGDDGDDGRDEFAVSD